MIVCKFLLALLTAIFGTFNLSIYGFYNEHPIGNLCVGIVCYSSMFILTIQILGQL